MSLLALQRCLNHEAREAVCRCPQCRNYFCRECVVSFENRMLCASCVAEGVSATRDVQQRSGLGALVLAVAGFLVVWLLFYVAGWTIMQWRERAPETDTSRSMPVLAV